MLLWRRRRWRLLLLLLHLDLVIWMEESSSDIWMLTLGSSWRVLRRVPPREGEPALGLVAGTVEGVHGQVDFSALRRVIEGVEGRGEHANVV